MSAVESEDEAPEIDSTSQKPDFVKKIEAFDIENITSENVEFMSHIIQDYFRENFPVKSELIDQLPERISVLNGDDYVKIHDEISGNTGFDPNEYDGFYSSIHHKMFINKSVFKTPGTLFATMFHESLHFTGIGAGAGLAGDFSCPSEIEDDEGMRSQIDTGMHTLMEGTTQLITLAYVVGDMGFDEKDGMFGYEAEWNIMDAVWAPFSRDDRLRAYFEMSMEDLRIQVEKTLESSEMRDNIGPDICNGMFAVCLSNLGIVTDLMKESLENWDDNNENWQEILKDVRHAVGLYIVRDLEINHTQLDEDKKEELSEYLEPYKEEMNV